MLYLYKLLYGTGTKCLFQGMGDHVEVGDFLTHYLENCHKHKFLVEKFISSATYNRWHLSDLNAILTFSNLAQQ